MYKKLYNYLIYDDGKVFSLYMKRFMKISTVSGYKQVTLTTNKGIKIFKVHRLVAYCFCNPPENYRELQVNHIDGNKANNNYTNLEWCTAWENNYHARKTGLNNISKSNHDRWRNPAFSKKTKRNMSVASMGLRVRDKNHEWKYDIRDKNGNPYSRKQLANKLGFSMSHTSKIIREYTQGIKNQKLVQYGFTVIDRTKKSQSTIESSSKEKNLACEVSRVGTR